MELEFNPNSPRSKFWFFSFLLHCYYISKLQHAFTVLKRDGFVIKKCKSQIILWFWILFGFKREKHSVKEWSTCTLFIFPFPKAGDTASGNIKKMSKKWKRIGTRRQYRWFAWICPVVFQLMDLAPNFPFELDAMLHEKNAVFPIYLGLQK